MKKYLLILLCFVSFISLFPVYGTESVESILQKVDLNLSPETVVFDAKMLIHQKGRLDTKEMRLYGKGQLKSFVVFLAPARDKDTKMLRLDDNGWLYLPSAEKIVKIAGHMLKQSFMGSDLSYADTTERVRLLDYYNGALIGSGTYEDRDCHMLDLIAKIPEAQYYQRKMWVDKEQYVTLKQEMYAKSGKLLKTSTVEEIQRIGSRFYPTKVVYKNELKKDSFTEMMLSNIHLNEPIPDSTFSMQNLQKK